MAGQSTHDKLARARAMMRGLEGLSPSEIAATPEEFRRWLTDQPAVAATVHVDWDTPPPDHESGDADG